MEELWHYLRWPVGAAYLWWAVVWALVARYYLRASLRQWVSINPVHRGGSLTLFMSAVLAMATNGLRVLPRGKLSQPMPEEEYPFPMGMVLRFGIVCSAACSILMGLTRFNADRSGMSLVGLLLVMTAVALSTVGGMIHLYVPMRPHSTLTWRVMMIFSWLGIGLAYLVTMGMWALEA